MKIRNLFILVGVLGITLASCEKKEPAEAPSIAVGSTSMKFSAQNSTQSLAIASNTKWTVSCDAAWLEVSPTSGEGDAKVSLSVSANEAPAGQAAPERTATVTVSISGKDIQVAVTQSGESIVFITTGGMTTVPETGGTVNVKVEFNTAYQVNIPSAAKAWIAQENTKAVATENLVFTVSENKGSAREAKIEFIPEEGYATTVTISQDACSAPVEGEVTKIGSAAEFLAFAASLKDYPAGKAVKLTADIDLTAENYTSADTLFCDFDGDGHTIKYSHIITAKTKDVSLGLFSNVKGSVKNLIVNAVIGGDASDPAYQAAFIGGIVGNLYDGALLSDCVVNADIVVHCSSTAGKIGGIVGRSMGGTIKNCTVKGMIQSNAASSTADQMGGVVGQGRGSTEIISCTNEATISYLGTSNPRTGSMVGYIVEASNFVVSGCTNKGILQFIPKTVKTQYGYIGGMIGYVQDSFVTEGSYILIENCANEGKLDVSTEASANSFQLRYGGILCHLPAISTGKASVARIKNCTYSGQSVVDVKGAVADASTIQVGGIFGFSEAAGHPEIEGCKVSGSIEVKGWPCYASLVFASGASDALSITDCTIEKTASIIVDAQSTVGVIAAAPAATPVGKFTGKVGGCSIIVAGVATTLTSSNYVSYLYGNDKVKDASGITFQN